MCTAPAHVRSPLKANQKADIGGQWFRYGAPKRVTQVYRSRARLPAPPCACSSRLMLQAPLVGRHSFRWRLWPADREPSRDICPLTTFTHSVQRSVPYNNLRHRHQKKVGEGRLLGLFKVHAPFRYRLCFVPRSALSLAGIAHALHQR